MPVKIAGVAKPLNQQEEIDLKSISTGEKRITGGSEGRHVGANYIHAYSMGLVDREHVATIQGAASDDANKKTAEQKIAETNSVEAG